MKKKSFIHPDVKQFFSIIPHDWSVFLKSLFGYSFWTVYDLVSVIFLGILISGLENGQVDELRPLFVMYVCAILICQLCIYLTRNWSRPRIMPSYQKVIHRLYLKKYIDLDIQYCEMIGT